MIFCRSSKENGSFRPLAFFVATVFIFLLCPVGGVEAKSPGQKIFASPEEAVQAVIDGLKADDTQSLLTIFGPGSRKIILSGDPIEDREGRKWFIKPTKRKTVWRRPLTGLPYSWGMTNGLFPSPW